MAELGFKELKAVLDGSNLDLNMRGIEKIPVKSLMKLTRATHLDFSTNAIAVIPPDFCLLTHITYLDLSSNKINFLPENFGNLCNLNHLDLYKNFIEDLPLSFGKLANLKWLDLKNNPLREDLQKVCGDCGDEKACKTAAYAVVRYIRRKDDEKKELIEKQNELNQRIEDSAKVKQDEDNMKMGRKRRKKQKKNHSQNQEMEKLLEPEGDLDDECSEDQRHLPKKNEEKQFMRSSSTLGRTLFKLFILLAIGAGLLFYFAYAQCERKGRPLIPLPESFCKDLRLLFTDYKFFSIEIVRSWYNENLSGFLNDLSDNLVIASKMLLAVSYDIAGFVFERGLEVFDSMKSGIVYYVEHRSELLDRLRFWWENMK